MEIQLYATVCELGIDSRYEKDTINAGMQHFWYPQSTFLNTASDSSEYFTLINLHTCLVF